MKIAAIIPAYNEAHTIGAVIRAIRDAKTADEILVVSDGSTDHTADVARKAGATVIALTKNNGKGEAMRIGATKTNADILFFCDGDLTGLRSAHVRAIIEPVTQGDTAMCVGLRHRWGIPMLVAHLDPLMAIGGERAIRRDVFLSLPRAEYHRFALELALNHYCRTQRLLVHFVSLSGVTHVAKEKKWGIVQGFLRRLQLVYDVVHTRLLFLK